VKALVGIACVLVLGGAGVASALPTRSASFIHYAGIVCQLSSGSVRCTPQSGRGYGVGISTSVVIVVDRKGNILFERHQP
jgi:hypothetical protein